MDTYQEYQEYWEENNIEPPVRIVVCAANRFGDIILCGARHWDSIMRGQAKAMGIKAYDAEQGFIDQFGIFLTREEAYITVQESGQPFNAERNGCDHELYSEGIY
jgi:hypothetical protein